MYILISSVLVFVAIYALYVALRIKSEKHDAARREEPVQTMNSRESQHRMYSLLLPD